MDIHIETTEFKTSVIQNFCLTKKDEKACNTTSTKFNGILEFSYQDIAGTVALIGTGKDIKFVDSHSNKIEIIGAEIEEISILKTGARIKFECSIGA